MSIDKYNPEHYLDLTAYEALSNMDREERRSSFRPIVYICSPYTGDVETNVAKAKRYCRYAVDTHHLPIAPHLFFPQFMEDGDFSVRRDALFMGLVLLSKCMELWVFGERISEGMAIEIEKAKQRGRTIRYFDEFCKEVGSK